MAGLRLGIFLSPQVQGLREVLDAVELAESVGFDYVSVQDHPYVPGFADTFALITHLAARTGRLRFMTNVANLPLRPAPMLAKTAATVDLLSGGRLDLGVGGGHAWSEIASLGGPSWSPGQTVAATGEAIDVLRAMWEPGRSVSLPGDHFSLDRAATGPAPAHPLGIWVGAAGPRMLDLLGRKADGWIAPMRSSLDTLAAGQARITAAADAAGRDPHAVDRVVQLFGQVETVGTPPGPLDPSGSIRADAGAWARLVLETAELGFDAVNIIPRSASVEAVRRFGGEVVPRVREARS